MRVLQVVHALPPATYGGTELYTRDLAEMLAAQGHETAVAAPRGTDVSARDADREMSSVETFELPGPGGETAPQTDGRPLDAVERPSVDDRFRTVLADWNPDVVHCQHLKHLSANLPLICERRGVPCIATLHDFWTICHREQLYRPEGHSCTGPESTEKCADCYQRAAVDGERATDGGVTGEDSAVASVSRRDDALRAALSATDRLVAPSAFLRETFIEYGTPPEKIEQCRNGIRVEQFEDTSFDPDGPLRVGYAGRITERKGVHLLVEAASKVENVDLHVFGKFDRASEEYHARLAELAGEAATFHGWYADQSEPYRLVDVFVLPSIWYENSPLVIQEAFAAGVPVVTADVGGMAELVQDGEDGLTFSVGDADALADALGRLAADPALVVDLRDGVTEPKRLRDHARELVDLYVDCTT